MAHHPNQDCRATPIAQTGTVIETDQDFRQALLSGSKGQQQNVPTETVITHPPQQATGRPAILYRPTVRPPVPILTVVDDGKADGEVIRIREPRFVIGRTEGHLRFPLDGRMSSRHVEITHQLVGGLHRWVVTDLQSTHGMFVRVSRAALADKAEFLVGIGRYRFDAARAEPDAAAGRVVGDPGFGRTQGLNQGTGVSHAPALTELLGREIGNRILLVQGEYWIGADPSCSIPRPDDPFCEARHVRLYRGSRGHWCAEHSRTLNGLWVRMAQITAESLIYFQVGEQRFKLKVG